MKKYEPFVIRVGEQRGNVYPVTAEFQGASWSGAIPAELPLLEEQEIQQALYWLERDFIVRDYAKDFGSRLFQTLFPDSIREGLRAAYERVAPEGGLRIVSLFVKFVAIVHDGVHNIMATVPKSWKEPSTR